MATLTASAPPSQPLARKNGALTWLLAGVVAIVVGLGVRVAIGGVGVGDRSAVVLTLLLALGGWLAACLVRGPRISFYVAVGLVALSDLAALPARSRVEYDDVQAIYRTDQVLTAQLKVPGALGNGGLITVVAQAVFGGDQPKFELAGTIDGAAVGWSCDWKRGVQFLTLPVPAHAVGDKASVDVQLHLSGTPSRESDYLLVYVWSKLGGPLIALESVAAFRPTQTTCALA